MNSKPHTAGARQSLMESLMKGFRDGVAAGEQAARDFVAGGKPITTQGGKNGK